MRLGCKARASYDVRCRPRTRRPTPPTRRRPSFLAPIPPSIIIPLSSIVFSEHFVIPLIFPGRSCCCPSLNPAIIPPSPSLFFPFRNDCTTYFLVTTSRQTSCLLVTISTCYFRICKVHWTSHFKFYTDKLEIYLISMLVFTLLYAHRYYITFSMQRLSHHPHTTNNL